MCCWTSTETKILASSSYLFIYFCLVIIIITLIFNWYLDFGKKLYLLYHISQTLCRVFFNKNDKWSSYLYKCVVVSFSFRLVVSVSSWPHGPEHARPSYLLLPPGVVSNSCWLLRRHCPAISSLVVPFVPTFPTSGSFPGSLSFRICPSSEHSGLISFRINRFVLLAVQGTLKIPLFKLSTLRIQIFKRKKEEMLLWEMENRSNPKNPV